MAIDRCRNAGAVNGIVVRSTRRKIDGWWAGGDCRSQEGCSPGKRRCRGLRVGHFQVGVYIVGERNVVIHVSLG